MYGGLVAWSLSGVVRLAVYGEVGNSTARDVMVSDMWHVYGYHCCSMLQPGSGGHDICWLGVKKVYLNVTARSMTALGYHTGHVRRV